MSTATAQEHTTHVVSNRTGEIYIVSVRTGAPGTLAGFACTCPAGSVYRRETNPAIAVCKHTKAEAERLGLQPGPAAKTYQS